MRTVKNNLLIITWVLLSSIVACKKNNMDSNLPVKPTLVKMVVFNNRDTTRYFYDNSNRILKISTVSPGVIVENKFIYTDSSVFEVRFAVSGAFLNHIFKLNGSGLVSYSAPVSNRPATTTYWYNTDKQILKTVSIDVNGIDSLVALYYYSNKNLDSVRSTINNHFLNKVQYEYYAGKMNIIDNENTGQPYLGAGNINPVKKMTDLQSEINFKYEYDERNRISKRITIYTKSPGIPPDATNEEVFSYY
jgi:hypothetical protein